MDLLIQVIFGLITALIIGAAMMVVTVRNIVHSALWLIASFFGVAALYMLLEAEFIAVAQVLVYVGAISVLILFAIMLTRHIDGEGVRQLTRRWPLAAGVAAAIFGAVLVPTFARYAWSRPPQLGPAGAPEALSGPAELGRGFVTEFIIQFEVAGVLLTVALIGAIVIAFEERARRRRVLTLAEEHALRLRQQALAAEAPARTAEAQEVGQ